MKERLELEIRDSLDTEVKEVEPPGGLLSSVMSRLGDQAPTKRKFGFIPRTRLAWVIVLACFLLIGGTAYAATSPLTSRKPAL